MNRSIFLLVSAMLFIACYFVEEMNLSHYVSPETELTDKRNMFVVKQGVSQDGSLAILAIKNVQTIAVQKMSPNHLQNLRVWKGVPRDASSMVFYVEQFRPHQFFEVRMTFHVSPETLHLKWTGPTSFMFCGTNVDEQLMRYEIELHLLELQRGATESSSCPNIKRSLILNDA